MEIFGMFGFVFGIMGIVFGIVSFKTIEKNMNLLKNKGIMEEVRKEEQ